MSSGWPGASVETEAELPLPARAERWAVLVSHLSALALCRRFMIARECSAASSQHRVLRVTNRQWQCLHPLELRRNSYNQHGPLVLCKACNFRMKYSHLRRSSMGYQHDSFYHSRGHRPPAEERRLHVDAMAKAATRFRPTTTASSSRSSRDAEEQSPRRSSCQGAASSRSLATREVGAFPSQPDSPLDSPR